MKTIPVTPVVGCPACGWRTHRRLMDRDDGTRYGRCPQCVSRPPLVLEKSPRQRALEKALERSASV